VCVRSFALRATTSLTRMCQGSPQQQMYQGKLEKGARVVLGEGRIEISVVCFRGWEGKEVTNIIT